MKRRIIVNNDFYNIFQVAPPVTDQDIFDAVDRVAGTQVDTLCLMVPDGLEGGYLDNDLIRLYDHPDTDPSINALQAMQRAGKDPFRMVLERAKQKDLEFFASIRMNDTHYKNQPFHPWLPRFYYDHFHNRIGNTLATQHGGNEFDYRKSAVREHYLEQIRRAVKYDVDGVELDMTRNCVFFPKPYAEECAPVMTQFLRDVRRELEDASKPRRKRLSLAVTVPYSLHRCRQEGLDVSTWARLGLIDLLCMSSPWLVETERDIADTVAKVGGSEGVPVYAGCDRNLQWPGRPLPKEAYRAIAANALRQGAQGFYAYNVMHWTIRLADMPLALTLHGGQSNAVHDADLMQQLGDLSTLERTDKLYILTGGGPDPSRPLATVPVTVPAGGEVTLRITIGDDIAKAAADPSGGSGGSGGIERIDLQTISADCGDYNNYAVALNTIELQRQYAFAAYALKPENRFLFPEPENTQPPVPLENVRRHRVRPTDLHTGTNYVTIKSFKDAMTITDLEIAIRYKK